ncbi:MAG: PAS domain-containing protein, partial [Planctomycetaceae bacterium]|nr:PAS domain-containing protein [Planctomycetaceae bacterium]
MLPEQEQENLQSQIAQLQRDNAKLARQLARLQTAHERNKQLATSSQSIAAMQAFEKRRQEQYMRLILENSPDIILLFDSEGRFSYCTNTFLVESGITHFFEINSKKFREIFKKFADEKWVDELAEKLISACKTRQIIRSEILLNLSGKEVRHYQLQFVPMQSTDFDGSLMMLHDVTDMRLAQQNAEEAKLLAEHASLAKSTFLSNMSHEIRTPLNAIIGMTAIGKSSPTIEKKEYCLGKIEGASTHLLGVINDILDISKIEANKFSISLTEFNFERMLQRVVNVINFRVEERGQELSVRIDRNIPAVIESDDQRIIQVLTNLLSNAVKFTPENGRISVNIALVSEEDNGDCVIQFDVTDTGIGISSEQKSRLFNAFEQADSSTSRNFGGTGLGLAISKRIVEMLNGKIWIESEL